MITRFYEDAHWIFLYEPVTVVVLNKKWLWTPHARTLSNPEYWNIQPVEA